MDYHIQIFNFQLQANQLNRFNVGTAGLINGAPLQADFNGLVGTVNEIIGALNVLPNGGCNGI